METASSGDGQGPREGTVGKLLLKGNRISLWDDEKDLELDDGDGCTTL